jgi:pantoate--beta-alanine ligase
VDENPAGRGGESDVKTITTIAEMKAAVRGERNAGRTIGFVPTMGALHEGHLSLVRASRSRADATVVSIFVNPKQFGPQEDFGRYPRDPAGDAALLEGEGTDFLFTPPAEEMYPSGFRTAVEVEGLQDKLCGRTRPGHFRGVCTIVLKLFQIVRPDVAFFGQKDAQQALILKKMSRDLDLDVVLDIRPIVRESDGLAMSSRNKYLSAAERTAALVLSRGLAETAVAIRGGERRSAVLIEHLTETIRREQAARIDYIEIVDAETLEPAPDAGEGRLVALAAQFGRTRLIDNMIVSRKG